MKRIARLLAALLVALAPVGASADDAAEAAYASYHRAARAGDVAGMLRLATARLRKAITHATDRGDDPAKLAHILPTAYSVSRRADGATRVVLELDGTGSAYAAAMGAAGRMRGKARLVREGSVWLVDSIEWLLIQT